MQSQKKEHNSTGCFMCRDASAGNPGYQIGATRHTQSDPDDSIELMKLWTDGTSLKETITITKVDALFLSKLLAAWGLGEDLDVEDSIADFMAEGIKDG